MSAAPVLRVEGLALSLGGRPVLRDVHLQLEAGEHVLLVGASGSGKSSLLQAVAGLLQPSAGRIFLDGQLATDGPRVLVRPERRGIGYLFQGGALWPHLSVAGTLDFVLRAAKRPRDERRRRVDELLEWVELTGLEKRRPGTLSGGEAQRLALARALAAGPRLLLLDEPLGPLDGHLRGALLARLADLQQRLRFAALHVTHDPAESAGVATRTLTLDQGRLGPQDVLQR